MSMILDHYGDKWNQYLPPQPVTSVSALTIVTGPMLTQAELGQLRADIAELKVLLERAREYDRKMNQPDCELDKKKEKLLKLAEELGIRDLINFL